MKFIEDAQEWMIQMLETLSKAIENLLEVMRWHNEIEEKELKVHLAWLEKKYEMLQRKFKKL